MNEILQKLLKLLFYLILFLFEQMFHVILQSSESINFFICYSTGYIDIINHALLC